MLLAQPHRQDLFAQFNFTNTHSNMKEKTELPCAATSSSICSNIRWALPGRLAIPLFDTSNRNNEHTYWNLRRSRTDDRKSKRFTASPRPLKPAISRVHRIVIWQWGGISVSVSSVSSRAVEFDLCVKKNKMTKEKKINKLKYVWHFHFLVPCNLIWVLIWCRYKRGVKQSIVFDVTIHSIKFDWELYAMQWISWLW